MQSPWPSNPYRDPLNGNDATAILRIVWGWIGNHHDHGYTGDDLIAEMERHGYECPDDLNDS